MKKFVSQVLGRRVFVGFEPASKKSLEPVINKLRESLELLGFTVLEAPERSPCNSEVRGEELSTLIRESHLVFILIGNKGGYGAELIAEVVMAAENNLPIGCINCLPSHFPAPALAEAFNLFGGKVFESHELGTLRG